MPDLEAQLRSFADAVLADVEPVTAGEVAGRRPGRSRLLVAAVGVAAAVALVAAVLAARDDTQTVDTVGPAGSDSLVQLLGLVPETLGHDRLRIDDLARARAAGLDPGSVGGNELFSHSATEIRAELGFDHEVVDQVVGLGLPPNRVTVARGRFDRAAIAAAVAADPIWSPLLEERTYEGVTFWSWGEDYSLNDRFSGLRGPGQSARLALVDDVVVWAWGDPELEAVLDAMAGRVPTLADDPDFRFAAEQADRFGLTDGSFSTRERMVQGRRDAESSDVSCSPSPCPEPVTPLPEEHLPLLAVDGVADDGARRGVAVLVYADEPSADAALDDVQRVADHYWQRASTADDLPPGMPPLVEPTVRVDGRAVVVTDWVGFAGTL